MKDPDIARGGCKDVWGGFWPVGLISFKGRNQFIPRRPNLVIVLHCVSKPAISLMALSTCVLSPNGVNYVLTSAPLHHHGGCRGRDKWGSRSMVGEDKLKILFNFRNYLYSHYMITILLIIIYLITKGNIKFQLLS